MDDARWHAFLVWLAAQGIARERAYEMLEAPRVLVDGTGVGSNTPFDAPYRRSTPIRRSRQYGWTLRARYRREPGFGSVKRAYGSYVGCRSAVQARWWVWGIWVLWNMVKWVNGGGGVLWYGFG